MPDDQIDLEFAQNALARKHAITDRELAQISEMLCDCDARDLALRVVRLERRLEIARQLAGFPLLTISRVEVIDHSPAGHGRAWVKMDCCEVMLSIQDESRTLKVLVK